MREAIENLIEQNMKDMKNLESVMRGVEITEPRTRGAREGRYFAICDQTLAMQAILDTDKGAEQ